VAPLEDGDAGAVITAVEATLHLLSDPVERVLSRWAGALVACGVGPDELATEGYGLRYAEALEELRRSPVGSA
jgi:hypothetical protein